MTQERIDIETMEARIRLWREGDISDEDLALEMDYMVPELKRCYEEIDYLVDMLHKLGYYGKNISEEKQLEWEEASE